MTTTKFATFSEEDKAFCFDLTNPVKFYQHDGELLAEDEYFDLEDCDDSVDPSSYVTTHILPSGLEVTITSEDTDGGTCDFYSAQFSAEELEDIDRYLLVNEVGEFTIDEVIDFINKIK